MRTDRDRAARAAPALLARLTTWLLLAALSHASIAAAGSLRIDPVRVALSAEQPTATLTIENAGTEAALVHAQLMSWTQPDGIDRYESSRELLVSPAVFELAPGAQQIVRVGLRHPKRDDGEQAYRLFVQEVPRPSATPTGMRVMLRLGVPVFVAARAADGPRVAWQCRNAGGEVRLEARNVGARHQRLTAVQVIDAATHSVLDQREDLVYLLPSATWRLALNRTAAERVSAGAAIAVRTFATGSEATADVPLPVACS